MRLFLALPLAGLLAVAQARADSVTDQIDQGKRLYEQGDVGGAVAELEFAIQELKGKQSAAYLATFPPAPAGWTLEEASGNDAASVPFLGNTASRTYRAQSGHGRDRGAADDRRLVHAGDRVDVHEPAGDGGPAEREAGQGRARQRGRHLRPGRAERPAHARRRRQDHDRARRQGHPERRCLGRADQPLGREKVREVAGL
jgi:hypothetical protein